MLVILISASSSAFDSLGTLILPCWLLNFFFSGAVTLALLMIGLITCFLPNVLLRPKSLVPFICTLLSFKVFPGSVIIG
ncbi:Protein of unknown function [Bacillus mycoides]|nr:Protein of unknown function [Bacillus mycoides]